MTIELSTALRQPTCFVTTRRLYSLYINTCAIICVSYRTRSVLRES